MTERDWNPDTGGRSLAEILREAGVESAQRSRRRGWNDPEETAIRQRRADAAVETSSRAGYARRRSDLAESEGRPAVSPARTPPAAPAAARRSAPPARPADPHEFRRALAVEPSTSAIPGLRPHRKPGVPGAGTVEPATHRRVPGPAVEPSPGRVATAAANSHPQTGPIPVVRPDEDADLGKDLAGTPRESALAWLRFAGELVIALATGVGIYFAARVLWENIPYVAVLLVPLAVTGLVLGVGTWRRRLGHEPVGHRLMGALVFAGTLLAVAPAAEILASG